MSLKGQIDVIECSAGCIQIHDQSLLEKNMLEVTHHLSDYIPLTWR